MIKVKCTNNYQFFSSLKQLCLAKMESL